MLFLGFSTGMLHLKWRSTTRLDKENFPLDGLYRKEYYQLLVFTCLQLTSQSNLYPFWVPYEEEFPEGANISLQGSFCPFGGMLDVFLHQPKVFNKRRVRDT
jgi:hypothetical protein